MGTLPVSLHIKSTWVYIVVCNIFSIHSKLRSFLQKGTRARPFLFWRVKGATNFDFGTFKGRLLLISAHLRGDYFSAEGFLNGDILSFSLPYPHLKSLRLKKPIFQFKNQIA